MSANLLLDDDMNTIWENCQTGARRLAENGIENADWESRALLCDQLNLSLGDFLIRKTDPMDEADAALFAQNIDRRCAHVPLQHILGKAYFYGLEFNVSPSVLIPRPETELLVEHALKALHAGMSVLDLCTGSGCIAITVSTQCPGIKTDASDVSSEALEVAKRNADANDAPVNFIQSDLFEGISGQYDMILSNPPYISQAEMETLMPEVKDHDPHLALYGGIDGLDFYKKISANATDHLNPGGMLMMEIGAGQANDVSTLLRENDFTDIQIIQDLNGLDRIVTGRRA